MSALSLCDLCHIRLPLHWWSCNHICLFPNGRADYRILSCIFICYRGSHKHYGGSSGGGGDGGGGDFGGAVVVEEEMKVVVMEVKRKLVTSMHRLT
jgi:hypothetical protein